MPDARSDDESGSSGSRLIPADLSNQRTVALTRGPGSKRRGTPSVRRGRRCRPGSSPSSVAAVEVDRERGASEDRGGWRWRMDLGLARGQNERRGPSRADRVIARAARLDGDRVTPDLREATPGSAPSAERERRGSSDDLRPCQRARRVAAIKGRARRIHPASGSSATPVTSATASRAPSPSKSPVSPSASDAIGRRREVEAIERPAADALEEPGSHRAARTAPAVFRPGAAGTSWRRPPKQGLRGRRRSKNEDAAGGRRDTRCNPPARVTRRTRAGARSRVSSRRDTPRGAPERQAHGQHGAVRGNVQGRADVADRSRRFLLVVLLARSARAQEPAADPVQPPPPRASRSPRRRTRGRDYERAMTDYRATVAAAPVVSSYAAKAMTRAALLEAHAEGSWGPLRASSRRCDAIRGRRAIRGHRRARRERRRLPDGPTRSEARMLLRGGLRRLGSMTAPTARRRCEESSRDPRTDGLHATRGGQRASVTAMLDDGDMDAAQVTAAELGRTRSDARMAQRVTELVRRGRVHASRRIADLALFVLLATIALRARGFTQRHSSSARRAPADRAAHARVRRLCGARRRAPRVRRYETGNAEPFPRARGRAAVPGRDRREGLERGGVDGDDRLP